MNLDTFQVLYELGQRATVYAAGTFVARSWQEVHEAVNLYYMPAGSFAEFT